jgi:hypothetical protein
MADPFAAYGGATLTPDNTVVTGNTDLPDSAGTQDPFAAYGGARLSPPPIPGTGMNRSGEIDFGSGGLQPAPTLSDRITGQDPVGDILDVAGSHLKNAVVGPYRAVTAPPQGTAENIANMAMPGGLPLYRSFVEPSVNSLGEAASDFSQGHYGDAANAALDAVPVVGPWAKQIQDDTAKHGAIAGLVGMGTDLLASKAIGAGLGAASDFTQNRQPVGQLAHVNSGLPGADENFTPQQHASLSGVLARGTGAGKGYFPKDVASSIGSALRQTAADNPSIASAIASGSPEDSLAGTQALLGKMREGIDGRHQQALQPVANTPIDPTPIQDAVTFPQSLSNFAPEDAAAVNDLKARLGSVRTLGGLNDLRMYLNQQLASQFRQNPVAAGNSGALTSAMQDALKATRDQYYQELENATGQNFQGAKRMESGVLSAEEALGNAAPGLAAKQAIAEQPRSVRGNVANAIQGANGLKSGPVAGVTQFVAGKILGETPMTPIQEGLRNFVSNLPARTPVPQAIGPRFSQGPTTTNPRIPVAPAQLPPQTEGQVPPAEAPQSLLERLADSYGVEGANSFPQPYREPAAAATPISDRGTIIVGSDGVAQRGPAGLLPAYTGVRQLGAGAGNPEFVVPPATPPPSFNPATARTNIYAGRPRPVVPPAPPRTVTVSPEGTAVVQRPQLIAPAVKGARSTARGSVPQAGLPVERQPTSAAPRPEVRYRDGKPFVQDPKTGWWEPQEPVGHVPAGMKPETHAFSRGAWSKANPDGDVEAATAAAKKLGFHVQD